MNKFIVAKVRSSPNHIYCTVPHLLHEEYNGGYLGVPGGLQFEYGLWGPYEDFGPAVLAVLLVVQGLQDLLHTVHLASTAEIWPRVLGRTFVSSEKMFHL